MKDELGDRMKSYYENRSKTFLARRTPVIIRLDGKAFHTFTRGFNKPFDGAMCNAMQETMKYLCENIQGCVLGYTQSDEITLVLIDYQKLTTDAWFDYNVQKICSVAASMATLIFNRRFQEQIVELSYNGKLDDDELTSSYKRSLKTGSVYHTSKECPSLKARNPEVKKISLSDAHKKGYKACKRCQKNQKSLQ